MMNYFSKKNMISMIQMQLSSFTESLKQCCHNAEPAFIRLGEELQKVHSDAEELTRKTVDTIKIMSGECEQERVLGRVASLAKYALSELRNRRKNVNTDLSAGNEMIKNLSGLNAICGILEKMAVLLKIVGLNMDIESSRYDEFAAMFGFVTRAIRSLSEKISQIIINIEEDSRIAYAKQSYACREIEKDSISLEELVANAEKTVKGAIQNIETFTLLSVESVRHANRYSEIVSENVAEIVVVIQFHDSMNQRIGHIVRAVEDMKALLTKAASAKNKASDAEILSTAHAIAELQVNQLEHIVSESQSLYEKCKRASERIGAEVGTLTQSLAMLGKSSREEPINELTSALWCLYDLLGKGRHLLDKIREATDHATETTDRLSDYLRQVRNFSFEIRLLALNSIIKASHIGKEGSTLEVLAKEMKKISDNTNIFADDVRKLLENISTLTHELRQRSYENSKDSGKVRKSLKSGIRNISDIYQEFISKSAEIFNDANNLKVFVEKTGTDTLLFFPKLSEQLKNKLEELKRIVQQLIHWAKVDIGEFTGELDKLGTRYTMKKERDIHVRTIGSDEVKHHGSEGDIEFF